MRRKLGERTRIVTSSVFTPFTTYNSSRTGPLHDAGVETWPNPFVQLVINRRAILFVPSAEKMNSMRMRPVGNESAHRADVFLLNAMLIPVLNGEHLLQKSEILVHGLVHP